RRNRKPYQRGGQPLSRPQGTQHECGERSMSDPTPNQPGQTDKGPPLPNLAGDVEMVAGKPSPSITPDDPGTKSASDLEAVFDVPVHVSAVLGRTRMDIGDLLRLGPGTVLELDR